MIPRAIGVDIGGSAIKLGVADAEGRVLRRATLPTRSFATLDALADALADTLGTLDAPALPIGLAAPGHLDPASGRVVDGTRNVPVLREGSLPEALGQRGARPVRVVNDGLAAAWGEARFGAGRGVARLALMTMGTGIGGAVILDGRPVTGEAGIAPEFGAIALDADGRTLEDAAGAAAFGRRYAARGGPPGCTPAEVVARAAAGDAAAEATIDEIARCVAQAFGMMVNTLALERCVVGGGVSAGGALLLPAIRAHLPAYTWPFLLRRTEVVLAARGNDAGLLGAAMLALEGFQGPP